MKPALSRSAQARPKKKGRVLAALPCDARLQMSMTAANPDVEQFIHGPGPDPDAGAAAVSHW